MILKINEKYKITDKEIEKTNLSSQNKDDDGELSPLEDNVEDSTK